MESFCCKCGRWMGINILMVKQKWYLTYLFHYLSISLNFSPKKPMSSHDETSKRECVNISAKPWLLISFHHLVDISGKCTIIPKGSQIPIPSFGLVKNGGTISYFSRQENIQRSKYHNQIQVWLWVVQVVYSKNICLVNMVSLDLLSINVISRMLSVKPDFIIFFKKGCACLFKVERKYE